MPFVPRPVSPVYVPKSLPFCCLCIFFRNLYHYALRQHYHLLINMPHLSSLPYGRQPQRCATSRYPNTAPTSPVCAAKSLPFCCLCIFFRNLYHYALRQHYHLLINMPHSSSLPSSHQTRYSQPTRCLPQSFFPVNPTNMHAVTHTLAQRPHGGGLVGKPIVPYCRNG